MVANAAKTFIIPLAILAGMLAAVYMPLFSWMGERFSEPNSYYSHGYLIPLIVAGLIWRKKDVLKNLPVSSSGFGLALLMAGIALHIVGGVLLKIGFMSGIAFFLTLLGITLYVFGGRITRVVLFPLLFVLCMVPVPKVLIISVTFKLKMAAAYIAEHIVSRLNVPLERAGSILYLPGGSLVVEEECSGISSLISLFTLSLLFAYIAEMRFYKRVVMVLSSLPVALAANTVRIVFLILAAYVYGIEAVENGILHSGAGLVLWGAALVLFSLLWRALAWKPAD